MANFDPKKSRHSGSQHGRKIFDFPLTMWLSGMSASMVIPDRRGGPKRLQRFTPLPSGMTKFLLSQNINIATAGSVGIAAVASISLAQLAGQFGQGRLRTLPLNASNRRYGATLAGVSNSHSGPIAAKGLNGDGAIALNADIHAPSIRALKRMKQDAAA